MRLSLLGMLLKDTDIIRSEYTHIYTKIPTYTDH